MHHLFKKCLWKYKQIMHAKKKIKMWGVVGFVQSNILSDTFRKQPRDLFLNLQDSNFRVCESAPIIAHSKNFRGKATYHEHTMEDPSVQTL